MSNACKLISFGNYSIVDKIVVDLELMWYEYGMMNIDPDNRWWEDEIEKEFLEDSIRGMELPIDIEERVKQYFCL